MIFRLVIYRKTRIVLSLIATALLVGLYQPPPDRPQEPPINPTTAERHTQTISGLEQARAIASDFQIK